jgi:hypothetical protein
MTEALAIAGKTEATVQLLHVLEPQPGAHRGEGMSAASYRTRKRGLSGPSVGTEDRMRHALGVSVVGVVLVLCTQGGCSGGDPELPPSCTPAPETCVDTVDNDCDGEVNEGCDCVDGAYACYGGPPETRHVGECRDGTMLCVEGRWQPCTGFTGPAVEANNCLDDDCDGEVDEDFPPPVVPGCHDPRRVLGWFSGDRDDQEALVVTGSQEEWLELGVSEDEHVFLQPKDLAIRLTLTGAGVNEFDLVARCTSCSAPAIASDWWSAEKEIPFMVKDRWLSDDDVVLLIHVHRMSGLACEHDPWTLTVTNAWHEGGPVQLTGWRECP